MSEQSTIPPAEVSSGTGGGSPPEDPHLAVLARHPKRAEMMVALSFLLSFGAAVALAVVYSVGGEPQLEGALLGVAFAAAGFGMAAWGKYLMPVGPFVEERNYEERHQLRSGDADRQAFAGSFGRGAVLIKRRSFLLKLMGLAGAAIGAVLVFPLRSLGPQPKKALFHTSWRRGMRMVTADGRPIRVDDIEVGGVVTVFPEGLQDNIQVQATSQTLLIHAAAAPIVTKPGRETWSPDGYLAFSKVCTHAGCPVGLYEEQTQQLLCPCHQSLFDVLDGAMPVFGPAPRPLPQLAIYADSDGFLRAQHDYDEPIGPGFWERGAT